MSACPKENGEFPKEKFKEFSVLLSDRPNYEAIIQYRAVQQMGHKISTCFFSAIVVFQLQR